MTQSSTNTAQTRYCDEVISVAARAMEATEGVTFEMIVDRMLTFCAAQMCMNDGSMYTAEQFRDFADRIDAGMFHRLTGEGQRRG